MTLKHMHGWQKYMPLEKEHLKISIRQRNSGKELESLGQTMGYSAWVTSFILGSSERRKM